MQAPGRGKTYQLAYKYVRDVIDQPHLYRHILAVTFTNKATEEMKSRILKEIHTLASGALSPTSRRCAANCGSTSGASASGRPRSARRSSTTTRASPY